MEYRPSEIEPKWRHWWQENQTYKVDIQRDKPKYYILDMFPYPSGAGLHVGHPLGYIASDIIIHSCKTNIDSVQIHVNENDIYVSEGGNIYNVSLTVEIKRIKEQLIYKLERMVS